MRTTVRFEEMRIAGSLPACGALLYVAQGWIEPTWDPLRALVVPAGLLVAGLLLTRWALFARGIGTAALAVWLFFTWQPLRSEPAAALLAWLMVGGVLSALWLVPGLPSAHPPTSTDVERRARLARARMALRITAFLAALVALSPMASADESRWAVGASLLFALGVLARARPQRLFDRRRVALLVLLVGMTLFPLWNLQDGGAAVLAVLSLLAVIVVGVVRDPSLDTAPPSRWWERLLENPARQLVATFLLLILLGTLLLGLPVASATGVSVAFVDAAFTAVSAVCVTGLIVLDTPGDWSPAGQAMILVLIQLGGLGIMSFATAFLSALGRRLSVRQESAFAEITSQDNRHALYDAVKGVLRVTFVAEVVGVIVLTWRFLALGDEPGAAVWRAVFTSVSAFCNAGFALQSDSLVGYARDPWVLHTVATLIVLGGLSPAVVLAVMRRRVRTAQTQLVLWTSGVLLVIGALLFGASEWNNVLAGFDGWDKMHNAWFQSVTLRTAGFNTVDIGALNPATVTLSALWMFIGGSPGGTAGGIKTTTFAVLLLAVFATVQGRRHVNAFGRSIPQATVFRATAVATIGSLALIAFVLSIQLTQTTAVVPGVFEVVSAVGTVGLSMGATSALDSVGKIIIMAAMFAGRVGSLTLLVFLLARRAPAPWRWPEEQVDVG